MYVEQGCVLNLEGANLAENNNSASEVNSSFADLLSETKSDDLLKQQQDNINSVNNTLIQVPPALYYPTQLINNEIKPTENLGLYNSGNSLSVDLVELNTNDIDYVKQNLDYQLKQSESMIISKPLTDLNQTQELQLTQNPEVDEEVSNNSQIMLSKIVSETINPSLTSEKIDLKKESDNYAVEPQVDSDNKIDKLPPFMLATDNILKEITPNPIPNGVLDESQIKELKQNSLLPVNNEPNNLVKFEDHTNIELINPNRPALAQDHEFKSFFDSVQKQNETLSTESVWNKPAEPEIIVDNASNKITLHMKQAHIGDITAKIEVVNKESIVTLIADSSDAKNMLQNHVGQLKELFEQSNVLLAQTNIEQKFPDKNNKDHQQESPVSKLEQTGDKEVGELELQRKTRRINSLLDTYA